ncbi:hypothetical protein AWB81_01884 [Caballeronia arationis]|uniref:hypothetical protein n=1 Tax=Caballeronia arationis TaxID=1777142 RepID=UPI00074CD332|nr:hypothetical protein [Caballeronia arationis]SAK59717.1 hypothetical protein AWB81_01884 [Caballeronia arationis]
MTTPNLIELYKWLMQTANLVVTSDNLVSGKLMNQTMPVLIKGKRLALPSPEHLANPDKSQIVLFHPLAESITRGESEVLEKFRSMLMVRFNLVAAELMLQLLSIAISTDLHAQLAPDQSEFLSKVKNADDKTYDLFKKVLAAMPSDQTARRIITIFLKKTGSVGGKRHKRVGVVTFPLYQELKKDGNDIYGIKCRVKDKETLIALMEFMFPQIDVEGSYHRGSDSDVAPNLDALMQASLAVIAPLNDLTSTFENQLGDETNPATDLAINCEWERTFDNLGVMLSEIRKVPMQAGNEGSSGEPPVVAQPATTAMPASYPQPTAPVAPAPIVQAAPVPVVVPAPVAVPSASPVSGARQPLDGFLAQREAERAMQQQHQEAWMTATHRQQPPVQPHRQPVYQQPTVTNGYYPQAPAPQQQPPHLVHTGRGLDFNSVLATNPSVVYATGGYPTPQQQAPMQQQGSRWANQQSQPMYPQQQPMYPQQGYQQPQGGYYPPANGRLV